MVKEHVLFSSQTSYRCMAMHLDYNTPGGFVEDQFISTPTKVLLGFFALCAVYVMVCVVRVLAT